MTLDDFIKEALKEDVGSGDFSSLACIPSQAQGRAQLLVKEQGIAAGIDLAVKIFYHVDDKISVTTLIKDGSNIKPGDILLTVEGSSQSILKAERLVLNCAQRMSGIATLTSRYVEQLAGLKTKLLDTRKTTPLCRRIEKEAVVIGGGHNHRFGLFDMIMLKDNHVDYAGGIRKAIEKTVDYLAKNKLTLRIEIETRNLDEVNQVLEVGNIDRIMLDNFQPDELADAVQLINNRYETEASGGIKLDNIRAYALSGVDYISVGALTHSACNLDLSLKAVD